MWLWVSMALAGSPWADKDASVQASQTLMGQPDEVLGALSNLREVASWFPESCTKEWAFGPEDGGIGARARVTYKLSWLRRRLTVEVSDVSSRRVVWDHLGNLGFYTYFMVEPTDTEGEVKVTMNTDLAAPPWPWRRLYFEQVQGTWQECNAKVLEGLAESL